MSKYKIIAAVQAKEFGAAVFDTLTKKLFVVDPGEGYSTESPLQSLFKQINADVVLYPQGESGNHTTKLALSELSATCIAIQDVVPIAKDKFTLEGHRIARLISQDTELVFHIDQEYINSHKASVACAGAMLGYLEEAEKIDVAGISINPLTLKCFMKVNPDTLSYLQVFNTRKHPNMHSQSKYREATSLFTLLDKTKSVGGRDMLRQWILCPLQTLSKIQERQEAVSVLALDASSTVVDDIRETLSKIRSIRTACFRIQTGMMLADLESLAQFSYAIVKLHRFLATIYPMPSLIQELLDLEPSVFVELGCLIIDTVDFESSRRSEQIVVAHDVNSTVDQLRNQFNALDELLATASSDMEELAGVPVVAVYFPQLGFLSSIDIALFNGESDAIPQTENWKLEFQTDKHRYYKNSITEVLDKSPGDVFTLLNDAEAEICLDLQKRICSYIPEIARAAELAAQIDCLQSLATVAKLHGYCQPQFNECGCYHVHGGRHPIVEASFDQRQFISNDINLASHDCLHMGQQTDSLHRMLVVLGPNASGKSVLIKQMALITYMAHIGSFVPATTANINLTDRIVAMGRATESLVKQQSAFSSDLQMVLDILKQVGPKTLVLLDEFGRGTSPIDGMGLLCGVLAALNDKPACLAVTHFQEIVRVEAIQEIWKRASIKTMSFTENENGLVYLFSCRSSDTSTPTSSYAITCARGAGIPDQILQRAQALSELERHNL